MLCGDLIPVCYGIHTKHINALPAGTEMLNLVLHSNQWALKESINGELKHFPSLLTLTYFQFPEQLLQRSNEIKSTLD